MVYTYNTHETLKHLEFAIILILFPIHVLIFFFLITCKYHINEKRFAKQDLSLTHLGKKKGKKQDGSTSSNTMDKLITYRIQRTISELNSLFDLRDDVFHHHVNIPEDVCSRHRGVVVNLFLCFQRWNTTA